MKFKEKLLQGTLIKRYKRFFVDIKYQNETITAHCPNTGSMMGLLNKGNNVWFSETNNPKRKLKYTLEIVIVNKKLVGTTGIQSSILFLQYIDNPPEYVATVGIFIFNNSYRGMRLGKVLVWAASYIFHNFTQSEWFGAGMEKENIT